MKFYLSTIADVDSVWNEDTQNEDISYVHVAEPIAVKYGFGLELSEFCISMNCDDPSYVMDFFIENTKYTKDLTFHAPYNELFPQAIDPAIVRIAEKRYDQSYKLCMEYGIKKMVVHANYVSALYFPSWFIAQHIRFWKKFLKEHPGDVQICLENVMENEPYLDTEIVKGIDDERFKMCFDMGHANLHPEHSLDEWIEQCLPYITHLHIHNNDGPQKGVAGTGDYHRSLRNGIIDYERLLKKLDDAIPDLTATIENNYADDFEDSAAWLKEKGFI